MNDAVFRLDGRTAVVTGSSRGIGAAVVDGLRNAGADVVGVARSSSVVDGSRDPRRGRGTFRSVRADLSHRAESVALGERLAADAPDILVLNHGLSRRAPTAADEDDAWDAMIEVNQNSYAVIAGRVARAMAADGGGVIIMTASMLSFHGGRGVPGYAASKHAIAGLVKAMSNTWAPSGIRVNAIAPGFIDTAMNGPLFADAERSRQIFERIPLGRWGEPDDLVGAVTFLASPAAAYITGIVLPVDGGWLAA
ncbi:SDR family oxidoreductase [Microbacterium sp. 179-I 3D3 NHS]|uniref:SDR family oxidoreductase n=1 Tax=Microbacterium sp. 179-I 3D3 NHS TaxID=3142382 RepID=UPI0039A0493E